MYEKFNSPDTLGIISSFPAHGGEVARGNAISRYTYLLTKNFPKNKKVVIFCEIRKSKKPYLETPNILVVPTYRLNSPKFFVDVLKKNLDFDTISSILIQFEFSIFGGKIVIPQIMALLFTLRFIGKNTQIMFHQVVTDINVLSGHLAIRKNGAKARILNFLLKIFYKSCGILSSKVFVHDEVLADRLSGLLDSRKVKIIPHAMVMEKKIGKDFIKASKKHFGVNSRTKLIGLFGYCSWYKGTGWLIENFSKFVKENPGMDVKLLVAGGESPTLKGTLAYQKYHKRLREVIEEADGSIVYTGYIPDGDVRRVFAATDLFVFPYRTKMSASGAFSLCLGFNKPYIVSKAFSENIENQGKLDRVFSLNYEDFASVLKKKLILNETSLPNVRGVSWKCAALMYLKECLPEILPEPKLNYAQAF